MQPDEESRRFCWLFGLHKKDGLLETLQKSDKESGKRIEPEQGVRDANAEMRAKNDDDVRGGLRRTHRRAEFYNMKRAV